MCERSELRSSLRLKKRKPSTAAATPAAAPTPIADHPMILRTFVGLEPPLVAVMHRHRARGRRAGEAIEDPGRDLAERLVVLILQVVAVGLLHERVRLVPRPQMQLGRDLVAGALREDAPDEAIGVDLIADALKARRVRLLRAAQRR